MASLLPLSTSLLLLFTIGASGFSAEEEAFLLDGEEQYDEALSLVKRLPAQKRSHASLLALKARSQVELGLWQSAESTYRAAEIAVNPSDPLAWYVYISIAEWKLRNLQESAAIPYLEKTLTHKTYPKDCSRIYRLLERCYSSIGDTVRAKTMKLAAWVLNPRAETWVRGTTIKWNHHAATEIDSTAISLLPPFIPKDGLKELFPYLASTSLIELDPTKKYLAVKSFSGYAANLRKAGLKNASHRYEAEAAFKMAFAIGQSGRLKRFQEVIDNAAEFESMIGFREIPHFAQLQYYPALIDAYCQKSQLLHALRALEKLFSVTADFQLDADIRARSLKRLLLLTFFSISWDPETGSLRNRDMNDFVGIAVPLQEIDSNKKHNHVSHSGPQSHQNQPKNGSDQLFPYGMVSPDEDLASFSDKLFSEGPEPNPKYLPRKAVDQAVVDLVQQGNFELFVKYLLFWMIEDFNSGELRKEYTWKNVNRRLSNNGGTLNTFRNVSFKDVDSAILKKEVPRSTLEAYEIAKRSIFLLFKLHDIESVLREAICVGGKSCQLQAER